MSAQPFCKVTYYDDLTYMSASIRRVLQDQQGMMWFATDNGLNRYDGYQFDNFKSQDDRENNLPSDMVSHLYLSAHGGLWCKIGHRAYLFDTRIYRYVDVLAPFEKRLGHAIEIEKIRSLPNGFTWLICNDGSCIRIDDSKPATSAIKRIPPIGNTDARITADKYGNSWVLTTKGAYVDSRRHLTYIPLNLKDAVSAGDCSYLLTASGRLLRYNYKRHTVKSVSGANSATPLNSITPLTNNKLAAFCGNTFYIFHLTGNHVERHDCADKVENLYVDKGGSVWIITSGSVILCKMSSPANYKTFSHIALHNCYLHEDRYHNIWFISNDGRIFYIDKYHRGIVEYPVGDYDIKEGNFIADNQDNVWLLNKSGVFKLSFHEKMFQTLPIQQKMMVRCTFTDHQKRCWVACRDDKTLRIFSPANRQIGYLGSDGKIHTEYTSFGSSVYCMYQTADNALWLGTKPDGLFRLYEKTNGVFSISKFTNNPRDNYSISNNNIYDIKCDLKGRLWIATLGGGLNCTENFKSANPKFININNRLKGYSKDYNLDLFNILITHGNILMAASTDGLLTADANVKDLSAMKFYRHRHEFDRPSSLSSNIVRGMLESSNHQIFVCTENNGVNLITSSTLTNQTLNFKHFNASTGLPSDIAQNIVESNHSLWVSSINRLIEIQLGKDTLYANSYLQNEHVLFSQAVPTRLADGRWLFGLHDGAIAVNLAKLKNIRFTPKIAITGISIIGGETNYGANHLDTLVLSPDQRNINIFFAALDYNNTKQINYAFKMLPKNKEWSYIKDSHNIFFADLAPGTYKLMIRSTNGDGVWMNNTRTLTLVVKPRFSETIWAHLLGLLIVITAVLAVVRTWIYIRRIKHEQRKTMNAYLALLNKGNDNIKSPKQEDLESKVKLKPEDNAFMNRVMEFIDLHISDSDINMDDMAQAAATSRSGLNRKIKRIFGVTPVAFLREARIRKSSDLLCDENLSLNDVAFLCGFSDPKYFSKCFKSVYGLTPNEYRQKQRE